MPVSEKTGEIENLIDEIAEILGEYKRTDDSIGLIAGSFSVALFLLYYSFMRETDKYQDNVNDILSEVFDTINKGEARESFCNGVAGVGWGMQHLVKQDLMEFDTHEFHEGVSEYLHRCMIGFIDKMNSYDYLHGAIGIGIYFLNTNINQNEKYVEELIMLLEKYSIKDGETVKWKSEVVGVGSVYNFSMSHGMASILVFLTKAYKKNIARNKCLELINGTVNYLLSNKLDTKDFGSIFPCYISVEGTLYESRLAWCYGDLGIGIAFWLAADATNNESLKQEAINIFMHATERTDLKKNGVVDAGICHGTAGIAHIFNRMYNYTGIERFKESSLYWLDHTLQMRTFPDGFAGYKAWYSKDYGGWQCKSSLLDGIAGIGLVLMSSISDIEPQWDECLLLS